jgi:hypothetical protein
MDSTKLISFNNKILDKNPNCEEHKSPIIAICLQPICNSKPICVNCLIKNHFKEHDQNNIIPIKEYLEKLDEYFESQLENKDDTNLLDIKTTFLDVLQNFKQETDDLVETLKNNIFDHFSCYDESNIAKNITEKIYSKIIDQHDPITSLNNELSQLGISYESTKKQYNTSDKESKKDKILNKLKLEEFLNRIEDLNKNLRKKLYISNTFFFRTFNITDDKVIKITETSEGINFKKVDQVSNTFLVISNEYLDFSKKIVWKVKPINLPSKWMGIGILPKDKFKREGWNSTDLIGLNCDRYYLDRGTNKNSIEWEVTTQSILAFSFDGPELTLKIENSNPKFEITAKNLDSRIQYCLALFFHYTNSEVLLLK